MKFRIRSVGRVKKCENEELIGGWKSRRIKKYLVFTCVCLAEEMEKWEGRKLFCLVEKKKKK